MACMMNLVSPYLEWLELAEVGYGPAKKIEQIGRSWVSWVNHLTDFRKGQEDKKNQKLNRQILDT
jgi:hypothetical protein